MVDHPTVSSVADAEILGSEMGEIKEEAESEQQKTQQSSRVVERSHTHRKYRKRGITHGAEGKIPEKNDKGEKTG